MTSPLTHPVVRRDPRTGRSMELWLDPSVQDVIDRLHHGDPTVGWEGDENLALYLEQLPGYDEPSWVLMRLEDDAQYHVVTRAVRPGVDLRKLPRVLVEHDRRRGFDPAKSVEDANRKAEAAWTERAADATAERLDKVVWGINRDTHGGALDARVMPKIARVARRLG